MITVTNLDGSQRILRRDEVGTIIGDDERDREDFLQPDAGAGIYLMRGSLGDFMGWTQTGEILQVRETPDEVAAMVNQ